MIATSYTVETPAGQNHWQLWIETVEMYVGRDLRRHDADRDNAFNAFMGGEGPIAYARALAYPHAVSRVLLWYTVIAMGMVAVAGVAAWFAKGGRL